jgi:ribonuclease HI
MAKKKQIYVVVKGRQPGIYTEWFGDEGAAAQVSGFEDALFKGFHRREDAAAWLRHIQEEQSDLELAPELFDLLAHAEAKREEESPEDVLRGGKVLIYTDGGAIGNPGPGGYGAVLRYNDHRRELSGGYRLTTNNRMELMACIKALEALKFECSVVLYSDSRYVVDGITEGWAERWRANGWWRNEQEKAENADLWARLLDLCDVHEVEFRWVKGHAGNPDNERCDQLAQQAARQANLPHDRAYEAGEKQTPVSWQS